MINDSQLPELRSFRAAERSLPISVDETYGGLVSPQSNETTPVFRWFRFKESFSAALVQRILRDSAAELGSEVRLLDPFCGVGTTLLAGQQLAGDGFRVTATGIEYNPFIHFVASTKSRWPSIEPAELMSIGARILDAKGHRVALPEVESITSGRCMSRQVARKIIRIRESIEREAVGGTRNGLLLGLASAIEPLSQTRKDGRALRLVERLNVDVRATIWGRWQMIADDVAFMKAVQAKPITPTVLRGDGRRPTASGIAPESIDLIVTSPPYPNNIDYTEVYKLELWLLGLVSSSEEFLHLRRQTFRSHPTTISTDPALEFLAVARSPRLRRILWPLVERTRGMSALWRSRLLLGYFEDLYVALKEYHKVLRSGGIAVFVVGNSLHGGKVDPYLIPTDLILAELARCCGFDVDSAIVARAFRRRLSGNHFLRETVLAVRKGHA